MEGEQLAMHDFFVDSRFSHIATFLRAPHAAPARGLDIALVGVPFDLGTNFRPGARWAPGALREASRVIKLVHYPSGISPLQDCKVADVGDVGLNGLDMADSLQRIETFFASLHRDGIRPVAVGGDHTIPLPILRAIARDAPVGLVQFDAHPDTADTALGTKINHATPFRRAVEEGLIDPKRTVQIGLRGSVNTMADIQWGRDAGMRVIDMDEYEALGRAGAIAEIRRTIGDRPAYVTFDIDGIDASQAPGTGVPEAGGLSVRDCQVILRALHDRHIIGADLCEVAPLLDGGGITAIAGVNILFELTTLIAASLRAR